MEQEYTEKLENRYQVLRDYINDKGSLAIAFSGGIDSVFLAKAAVDTLPRDNILALTSNSAIFPIATINYANNAANFLGIQHQLIDTDELSVPEISNNTLDHCYHCKRNMLGTFTTIAKRQGFRHLADGTNFDDIHTRTPARRVAAELGSIEPLAELSFTKKEIRDMSRWLELPMWNQYPEPCLVSRVTLGIPITPHLLASIQAGEFWLSKQGFLSPIIRVESDSIARIYVEENDFDLFANEKIKDKTVKMFKELGFSRIAIDLEGMARTMNGFSRW